MKSIIVARVSTEEQKEVGSSLPTQLSRMRDYCERKKYQIQKEFSFDESAYKTRRDEFDKIIDFVKGSKEKIAVCFDRVDRLSRNIFDKRVAMLYDMAVENKIELHFISDNQVIDDKMSANDKFIFGIKLGLSKYYSDAISDNVKKVFAQKRRDGKWIGRVRIGYLNVVLDAEKRLRKDIIIDPERGHLIRLLFELYSTGNYSITTLLEEITRRGLRNREGKKLSRSNIEYILKDPFYYGMAYSKKYGLYPHVYKTLISKELFDKCQEVMASRRKMPSKMVSVRPYIFQGLLRCQNCGCLMTPEIKKGKFIYYSCTNAKGNCQRVYVPEKALLEPVHKVFEAFQGISKGVQEWLVSELRKLNESEAEFHQKQIQRIRSEYDRIQGKIERYTDLLADTSITKDLYDKKLTEFKSDQYRLGTELEEHTKADHEYHIHVATVLNLSRKMKEIFESSEIHEKRAILNFLLQNPTVLDKKLEFTLKKPFDAVLMLARTNDRPTLLPG